MGSNIILKAADGHSFDAYVATPADGKRYGAIVVVQEIFGVNKHIREIADGYAAQGYMAIAPALYDRVQRNYESGYEPADIQAGLKMYNVTLREGDAVFLHTGWGDLFQQSSKSTNSVWMWCLSAMAR